MTGNTRWITIACKFADVPGTPLDTVGNAARGTWVELDVVAAPGNSGRVSLALTNDSNNLVTYSSKEGAHPPQLVVVTD